MKALFPVALLSLLCAPLFAQTPTPQPTKTEDLGFTYQLPTEWQLATIDPDKPPPRPLSGKTDKAAQCSRIALRATYNDPPSVVLMITLPYSCYGQMNHSDFEGFTEGAAVGLKQAFLTSQSVTKNYTLADRPMWAERSHSALKEKPEKVFTTETICGLFDKAAVCWMTLASDDTALKSFEQSTVTLKGNPPAPLVPESLFTPVATPNP